MKNVFVALLIVVLPVVAPARCQDIEPPFVAGFERFARFAEIEPAVAGRLLISELSCVACHASKDARLQPKRGPRLDGVSNRISLAWIRRFLASPHSVNRGTTMPDVLAGFDRAEKAAAIDALVAFLSTQRLPFPEIKATGVKPVPLEFWKKGKPDHGQALFHQIGCVACHQPNAEYGGGSQAASALDKLLDQLDPDEIKEMGLTSAARPVRSNPHGELSSKYTRKSLTHFLLDPAAIRPAGRMPSFKLEPVEAADLAAYLLRDEKQDEPDGASNKSLVEKGRHLFVELRCANCHVAKGVRPTAVAKPLADLNFEATKKCYGATRPGVPHFNVDDRQIESLREAVTKRSDDDGLPPKINLELAMLQLNCYACHERDQRGGVGRNRRRYFENIGHVDLGDEGRIPPPLTGVGKKLHPGWLKKILAGSGNVRPYMLARMPVFPQASVASLPGLFAQADGATRKSEADVFGDLKGLTAAGRHLLDTGCVQCHPLRGESLPGVVGIDLVGISTHVQPEWFREFLFDPAQLKTRTRMPTFFPKGKSSNPDVLDGDVDRQIAAMWAYLKDLDKQPLPEKLVEARSKNYELVPKDRPILLRTFMDHVGTHAIAVGFPKKVHFAFDAENIRLTQAWRGRFLDAYGTWFMRFTPPADPLGDDLIAMPPGVPFAQLDDTEQAWPTDGAEKIGYQFGGYRLDRNGAPTFLYRFDRFDIEDRIEPNDDQGLDRRLQIKPRNQDDDNTHVVWLRLNVGKSLKRLRGSSYTNDAGLTTTVLNSTEQQGKVRKSKAISEWIIPIQVDETKTIELEYQWKR